MITVNFELKFDAKNDVFDLVATERDISGIIWARTFELPALDLFNLMLLDGLGFNFTTSTQDTTCLSSGFCQSILDQNTTFQRIVAPREGQAIQRSWRY